LQQLQQLLHCNETIFLMFLQQSRFFEAARVAQENSLRCCKVVALLLYRRREVTARLCKTSISACQPSAFQQKQSAKHRRRVMEKQGQSKKHAM
jgi:hypothetical protein